MELSNPNRLTISIIIPTYNRTTWLRDAIESALGQTHPEVEVIVVDDGSTTDEVKKIASTYSTVHYYYIPNQGPGIARNHGTVQSSGHYLLFLDDDDWLTLDAVSEKLQILEEHPNVGAVYSNLQLVSSENKIICNYYDHRLHRPPSGDLYQHLLPKNFIPLHAILWRRSIIEEAGGFPEFIGAEDWYLLIRAAMLTEIMYLDRIHGGYRIHETNITRLLDQQTTGYTHVQKMVYETDRFSELPANARAKILSHYAVLQMMSGDEDLGRKYLADAMRFAPWHPVPLLLNAAATLGRSQFQRFIRSFRRIRYLLRPIPSSTSIFLSDD